MSAYYNEHDPFAAAWLRALIARGLIASGDVDERDIQLVQPEDIRGYAQHHFFAGIGGWSYALRLAGWSDDRPVWTGSCPCQPFSAAGKGGGHADARHLWPEFGRLIAECRPPVVFGEQVASPLGRLWLTAVRLDLEGVGYAVGAADLCAASVGAPHIRQRLLFVAEPMRPERRAFDVAGQDRRDGPDAGREEAHGELGACGQVRGLAHAAGERTGQQGTPEPSGHGENDGVPRPHGSACGMADPDGRGRGERGLSELRGRTELGDVDERSAPLLLGNASGSGLEVGPLPDGRLGIVRIKGPAAAEAGVVGGFWRDADLILCADRNGWKWRPVDSGTFPLASGLPARVGRLRGSGNSIVPQVAAEFIQAWLEVKAAQVSP